MKITLLAEDRIRFDPVPGPLSVEAESAEMSYSPFHMLASGLAVCVISTVSSWANNADIPTAGLAAEVSWEFADKPHRVGRFHLVLEWPGLAEERRATAIRAAGLCPAHKSFELPTEVHTEIRTGAAE
ncbi:hypothetical protein BH23GEM5_BH23GEM5_13190 [soil metagenome]